MLFSKTKFYTWFRILGVAMAGVAALGWIVERSIGKSNFITVFITKVYPYAMWCVIALAVLSIAAYVWNTDDFKHRMLKAV